MVVVPLNCVVASTVYLLSLGALIASVIIYCNVGMEPYYSFLPRGLPTPRLLAQADGLTGGRELYFVEGGSLLEYIYIYICNSPW